MQIEIRKLQRGDNRQEFRSGDIEIDRFFIKFAGQNQFKHKIGTTYVAIESTTQKIVGYATVSIGSLNIEDFDSAEFGKFPKYPMPIMRIARLGVDERYQSQGVGFKLLQRMIDLSLEIEDLVGCIGIFVDAKEEAVAFYAKYAFEIAPTIMGELPTKPKQTLMYLSTKTIYKVFK